MALDTVVKRMDRQVRLAVAAKSVVAPLFCASRNSMVLRADPGLECKSAASFPDPARCRRCGGCAETIFLFPLARRNVGSTNLPDGIRGRECGSRRDECLQVPAKSCRED